MKSSSGLGLKTVLAHTLCSFVVLFAGADASALPSSIGDSHHADPIGAILQKAFVWCPTSPVGTQAYAAFRAPAVTLSADADASSAVLYVFADSRYFVWFNGVYVARGPGRFNPVSPDYDIVNVSSLLAPPGTPNSLVILVHTYGAGVINGRIMAHDPGLTAILQVDGAAVLTSGPLWHCNTTTEYLPSPGAWSSIPDVIDTRVVTTAQDWAAAVFDDSTWAHASPANGSSWGPLALRPLPMPTEKPLLNVTVAATGQPLAGILPLTLAAGNSIVLNLGQMAMAYPLLDLATTVAGSTFTLSYALRFINGAPGEEYGVGSAVTLRAGAAQHIRGGDTWVSHYVTLACAAGTITVSNLTFFDRSYPFNHVGSFAAQGDDLLTTLWARAAATLATVTDDAYGSDARERNEWLQDPAEPNFLTTNVAFAAPATDDSDVLPVSDPRLLKLLLRHAALSQLADGRILATFPTDRGPSDCHYFIEDYAMQWVEALRMYYEASGDLGFVAAMWPTLVAQMNWFLARRTPAHGLLLAREYTSFDDPLAYITLEGAALNAFFFKALRDAAYLGTAVGEAGAAANYSAAADALGRAFDTWLWNTSAASFNSGILPDGTVLGPTPHAAMMALQRGVVQPSRTNSTVAFFLATFENGGGFHVCSNPDFMAMVAARAGIGMTVSHYWIFEVLYGLDTAAADVLVLQRMRSQWAHMIETGGDAGTVWETLTGPESCHNYGAVPASFLSHKVLGVRMAGPVWDAALLVEPHPGDLLGAQGTVFIWPVVTPLGPIGMVWARNTTAAPPTLTFAFTLPHGCPATVVVLRIPDAAVNTLLVNGTAPAGARQDGRYAALNISVVAGVGGTTSGSVALL